MTMMMRRKRMRTRTMSKREHFLRYVLHCTVVGSLFHSTLGFELSVVLLLSECVLSE